MLRDRRAGLDQPAHRPLRRQARPGAGARDLRPGAVDGARARGAFQDVDLSAVFRDVAAWTTARCTRAATTPSWPRLAVKHALDGRGVAHLVLPDEVQVQPSDAPPARRWAGSPTWPRPADRRRWPRAGPAAGRPPPGDHRRATAPGAPPRSCARWPNGSAPRCSPRSRPRAWCPTPTRSVPACSAAAAPRWRRWLMNESDLLLVVGASFANHTGIAPYKPIVQIDDAPAAIGRFHPVDVGDPRRRRADAAPRCSTRSAATDGRPTSAPTSPRAGRSGARRRPAGPPTTGAGVSPPPPCSRPCPAHCPADAVVTVDVGNHAYSFGRYLGVAGPAGAHVRLPRLDRVRLPGRDGCLGRRPVRGRSSR